MASLEQVFNHVVLPPKLPGGQDDNIEAIGHDLLRRLRRACGALKSVAGDELQGGWNMLDSALEACQQANHEIPSPKTFLNAFDQLDKDNKLVILYLQEQNAGLLMHRETGLDEKKTIVFEAFEASPQSQEVLAVPNALRWDFPSRAVQISEADFLDADFQFSFATFLDKASSEQLSHLAAKATKAGVSISEVRNTGSPALITHMLFSLLQAMGCPADVRTLEKRVRDDVNLDNSGIPWRRLPFWLVLRVAMQRQLGLVYGSAVGYSAYKIFSCMLLSQLLHDCVDHGMHPTLISLLQKKLGRKLAKLEKYQPDRPLLDSERNMIRQLMDSTAAAFASSIDKAARHLESELTLFKHGSLRKIPKLPLRANNNDLRLSLPSSGSYLQSLLLPPENRHSTWSNYGKSGGDYHSNLNSDPAIQNTRQLSEKVLNVVDKMIQSEQQSALLWQRDMGAMSTDEATETCGVMAATVSSLIELVAQGTNSVELNSALLLDIFDQWAIMDAISISAHPMIEEYKPLFPPSLLDVLQLPDIDSMRRLRRVQRYLRQRCASSDDRTLFDKLDASCFGTRFAKSSATHMSLYQEIRDIEDRNRQSKTREWERDCQTYDQLSREYSSLSCKCTFKNGERVVRGCNRCYKWRVRNRMEIGVCEDLLPKDDSLAKAIVFELKVPECIAIYRTTTWKIVTSLAYPRLPTSTTSGKRLYNTALAGYGAFPGNSSVSLASFDKAFRQAHYKKVKMRASLDDILLPLGSRFKLYDSSTNLLIDDLHEPLTLAHLCNLHVPNFLRTTVLPKVAHPPTNPVGPSSYEAVASRPECPNELSIHEFEAFQRLLSGSSRRWLTMLVELGCSNVNFSKQDAMLVFSHLAHQAGPLQGPSVDSPDGTENNHGPDGEDNLGVCHNFFSDEAFVQRLLKELEKRLRSIQNNWREASMMELLITLLLRAHTLVSEDLLRAEIHSLLQLARSTTLAWTDVLRNEVMNALDGDASQRASMYAFKAALLCRRTYTTFARDDVALSPDDLSSFIKASVSLQQNLIVDASTLLRVDQDFLTRDTIMAYQLRQKIREAIESYPGSISEAVFCGAGLAPTHRAPGGNSSENSGFDNWVFLTGGSDGWVTSVLQPSNARLGTAPQYISFHYTQGYLLVNGRTIGKLPDDIRDSDEVKELLGDKHLLTYPSAVSGMSHRLVPVVEDHIIHFGRHGDHVIILSVNRSNEFCEYVPRRVFIDPDGRYDLPRGLIDHCCHWFNRTTSLLEMRRNTTKWFVRPNDWKLNVIDRNARRRDVLLVDPRSETFKLLAAVFRGFDDLQRLTVFQPIKAGGALSVELRHLDLSFFVNRNGNLECRELGTEVDTNQDAGTLYGYQSMIVLRDIRNAKQRSIIAPLGGLIWKCSGSHISLSTAIQSSPLGKGHYSDAQINSEKAYARFDIDEILGRLTCPPEPRLLYTKAQLHAFTSHPLPDPLTGRTGEEEAFHTLLSGRCQPWITLQNASFKILGQISKLAPKREYYPKELRVLQKVTWDQHLPLGMQNDRYGRTIREIASKAYQLYRFDEIDPSTQEGLDADYKQLRNSGDGTSDYALENRGEVQRLRYECPREDIEPTCPVQNLDRQYTSLGFVHTLTTDAEKDLDCKASAVFQIVKMLRDRPEAVPMSRDISSIFNSWKLIGGFGSALEVDLIPISSLMDGRSTSEQWGSFAELCRQAADFDASRVMFTLAHLAFAPKANMDAIRLLAAYSYLPQLTTIQPPPHASFSDFSYNEELTAGKLISLIETEYVEYKADNISATGWDDIRSEMEKERASHMKTCREEGARLASALASHWPESNIPYADGFTSDYINVHAALRKVSPKWERLLHNRSLSEYATQLQRALSAFRTHPRQSTTQVATSPPSQDVLPARTCITPSLAKELVARPTHSFQCAVAETRVHKAPASRHVTSQYFAPREFPELRQIVAPFMHSAEPLRQGYGRDLAESLAALEHLSQKLHTDNAETIQTAPSFVEISDAVFVTKKNLKLVLEQIKALFSESVCTPVDNNPAGCSSWLQRVGLWPRLTPVSILELLRSSGDIKYGDGMRTALVHYGELLTSYQRFQRIYRAMQNGDDRRIAEEIANEGHTNWSASDRPDWLLLEIDADLLIREEQVDVARAMISPESGSNSVSQLNMGKGKTSVILPMVLSVLANGSQLSRLIVPKALLLPTAQIIQSRLGGLIGREVRHVSFSRRLITGSGADEIVGVFKNHHEDLALCRGILLAAPEHILAFKLSGLQCLADGKNNLALEMTSFQARLENSMCRDVLDESDFTLAVRTQLVYPSGQLTMVDGAPYRWKLVQTLLSLVEDILRDLRVQYPNSINVIDRPGGGFPMVYILQSGIEDELHRRIVQDISHGRVSLFRPAPEKVSIGKTTRSMAGRSPTKTTLLLEKALRSEASDEDVTRAASMFTDTQSVENGLLLVQGFLKHSILLTCLKKRWNVQYGLHPKRWPIAVPFEARGVPSERSEFGHPDVSIIFTCLAFYYSGVNLAQFRDSLNQVLHHVDDPATEYEKWASGDGSVHLPEDLQHWNAINIDDEGQVEKLWKYLRFTRSVINHFLNTFVFPLHCRQFSVKLQASAWDLPLFTPGQPSTEGCRIVGARTTGFSGTNDNKVMLPLTIKQEDLPGLRQTNAEVLTYLLQPRNRQYVCTGGNGPRWTEDTLLTSLKLNNIRVLIDAGAYILEKSNESLARAWLAADGRRPAAVYFGEKDNRAWVLFRDASASKAPLVSTPFVDRLDECLVYFDEAHTRGVDLRLPPNARGALTLALGQTKDHTMQAAMRLRQLGSTQSVLFYAPPEVDKSIRDFCGQGNSAIPIQSPHVISWLLEQTCKANEQLQSLYASHGRDFCRRTDANLKYRDTLNDKKARSSLVKALEQPERQTLKVMYGSGQSDAASSHEDIELPELQKFAAELNEQQYVGPNQQKWKGNAQGAFEEVEQEREVEVQVEQERVRQRRKKYTALSFPGQVSKAIRSFVWTGELSSKEGYQGAFDNIAETDIGKRYGVKGTESRLFVSDEFGKTISAPAKGRHPYDDFLRPVEWLLWSPSTETGIVVIPEELELLIPALMKSKCVHLLTYAAPVARSMLDFSSLEFYSFPTLPTDYTLPTWLPIELGILAGRLYMLFSEAKQMTEYLGRAAVKAEQEDEVADSVQFCSDPAGFLLEWLPLRRLAQDITHTPAAYVCQGRTLRADHAFFAQSKEYEGPVSKESDDGKHVLEDVSGDEVHGSESPDSGTGERETSGSEITSEESGCEHVAESGSG